MSIGETTTTSIRRSKGYSYRLAGKNVLDLADRARSLDRRAREDGEARLRRVQHLLDVRQDARDVWGDKGVLWVV